MNLIEEVQYAPGVRRLRYKHWRAFEFIGSRSALVTAGLAESGWFPGEPGQKATAGYGKLGGYDVHVAARYSERGVFVATVPMHSFAEHLTGPFDVPIHIQVFNDIVAKKGIKVTVERIRTKELGTEMHVRWDGKCSQLVATKLLKPNWRFPMDCGALRIPHIYHSYWTTILDGEINVNKREFFARFHANWPDESWSNESVTTYVYQDGVIHHGPQAALLAAGVCNAERFPKNRDHKQDIDWRSKAPHWYVRRLPTGKFIHWTESRHSLMGRLGELASLEASMPPAAVAMTQLDRARDDQAYQAFLSAAMNGINDSGGATA